MLSYLGGISWLFGLLLPILHSVLILPLCRTFSPSSSACPFRGDALVFRSTSNPWPLDLLLPPLAIRLLPLGRRTFPGGGLVYPLATFPLLSALTCFASRRELS